jgi:hypothetical protein
MSDEIGAIKVTNPPFAVSDNPTVEYFQLSRLR